MLYLGACVDPDGSLTSLFEDRAAPSSSMCEARVGDTVQNWRIVSSFDGSMPGRAGNPPSSQFVAISSSSLVAIVHL